MISFFNKFSSILSNIVLIKSETFNKDNKSLSQFIFQKLNQTSTLPLKQMDRLVLIWRVKNAMKFGYKFKVISGYLFDKKYIFNEYVDSLYNLKSTSVKGTPYYVISKLLMNSLYCKFGAVAPWLRRLRL